MSGPIRREKTAANRKNASAPTRWAFKQGLIRSVVFDWGCGKGKDSSWLKEQGMEVISYDPYFEDKMNPEIIDFAYVQTILLIDVLSIIEDREERENLLYDVASLSKKDTIIIASVPRIKTIEKRASKSNWDSYADGFIAKNKTFIKGYTLGDFADSCMKMGSLMHVKKMKGSFVGVIRSE
jgi:DNA phosphorothioation-associated putative methyltransferase